MTCASAIVMRTTAIHLHSFITLTLRITKVQAQQFLYFLTFVCVQVYDQAQIEVAQSPETESDLSAS